MSGDAETAETASPALAAPAVASARMHGDDR
jgi:hypothetical protein